MKELKEIKSNYYKRHRKKLLENGKNYYKQNKEKVDNYFKEYYKKKREEILKKRKIFKLDDKTPTIFYGNFKINFND